LSGGNAHKKNIKQLGKKTITQTYNPVDGEWSNGAKNYYRKPRQDYCSDLNAMVSPVKTEQA
jgi:hypothetical protein